MEPGPVLKRTVPLMVLPLESTMPLPLPVVETVRLLAVMGLVWVIEPPDVRVRFPEKLPPLKTIGRLLVKLKLNVVAASKNVLRTRGWVIALPVAVKPTLTPVPQKFEQ